MLGKLLIAQAPVLPELKRPEEHDDSAEGGMPDPEHLIAGIAEDEGEAISQKPSAISATSSQR